MYLLSNHGWLLVSTLDQLDLGWKPWAFTWTSSPPTESPNRFETVIYAPPTTSKLIVIQDPKRVKVSIKKKVNVSFDKEDRQQKSVRRCTAMPLDLIALCIVSYHFILLCCRIQIEADCATGSLLPWFAALKARLPKLPDGEDVDTRWP